MPKILHMCECRQVKVLNISDVESGIPEECPEMVNIQKLCNGTTASPCDCQTFQECQVQTNEAFWRDMNKHSHTQCSSPYVGNGSLCVMEMATQTEL